MECEKFFMGEESLRTLCVRSSTSAPLVDAGVLVCPVEFTAGALQYPGARSGTARSEVAGLAGKQAPDS